MFYCVDFQVYQKWCNIRSPVCHRSAANSFSPQRQQTLFPRHRHWWNELVNATAAYSKSGWITEIRNCRREADVSWRMVRRRTPIFRQIRLWRASMWADQVRFSSTVTPRSTAWDTILIGELFKYIKGLGVLVEKELAIIIDAVFSSDIVRPFSSSRMEMSWRALVAASAASVIVGRIL